MTEALKRSLERSRSAPGLGGRRLRDERGPSVVCGRFVLARERVHEAGKGRGKVRGKEGGGEGAAATRIHPTTKRDQSAAGSEET